MNELDSEEDEASTPNRNSETSGIFSHRVLLEGNNASTKSVPYLIYVCPITEGINLIYAVEVGNSSATSAVHEAFVHLHVMQVVQLQRDIDTLRPAFENLDLAVKKLSDVLKKLKNGSVETSYKQLIKKWEFMRKKYQEFLKNSSDEALLRAETCTGGFLENLKELFGLSVNYNCCGMELELESVALSAGIVGEKLLTFNDFLKVKAIKNFSLGSYPFFLIGSFLSIKLFVWIILNFSTLEVP